MIIGVTGKAGSGKDTVANFLVAKYGFRRAQFAYDLKRIVCEIFGWNRDALDNDAAALGIGFNSALMYKENVPLNQDGTFQCPGPTGEGMSRREVLQFFGTDCMRVVDPDIHVKLTMARMAGVIKMMTVPKFVFADVRFCNEADAIKKIGGEVWRVVKTDGPGTDGASHVSETEMDLIEPDHTLGAVHGQIPFLLSQVGGLMPACD